MEQRNNELAAEVADLGVVGKLDVGRVCFPSGKRWEGRQTTWMGTQQTVEYEADGG